MNVISAKYYNSGGNVLVYYGKLDNGRYYSLGLNQLFILDADYEETLTEEFHNKTEGDTYEWNKQHIIEKYEFPTNDNYATDIVKDVFKVLKETYPDMRDWDILCNKELCI